MFRMTWLGAGLCMALFFTGCGSSGGDTTTVAWVTNGIADFWTIGEKGARDAARDLNVKVEVRMPAEGLPDQKRMVQELLTQGVDGIAISPIDPDNQGDLLKEISARTLLITHDSDAPESDRLCYIGMDNYEAGRMCGQLVRQAIPDGGSVMIFVGRLGQLNARQRRQGLIDELLDRAPDATRYDEPGTEIKGEKYVILDTRTDDFDRPKAKALAQDAIVKYPDLGCMVGLFEYNPPILLDAVSEASKLGKIKLVGFDENDRTLQGIIDGHVEGTIVQNPYEYGRQSVRLLVALHRKDNSMKIPPNKFIDIPARSITRDNVEEFWKQLKQQTGKK